MPYPDEYVIGEKDFHIIVSQIFVAINNDIPDPNPNPCFIKSSSKITIIPAVTIYKIIITDKNAPI